MFISNDCFDGKGRVSVLTDRDSEWKITVEYQIGTATGRWHMSRDEALDLMSKLEKAIHAVK